jgi:hypothetical protein
MNANKHDLESADEVASHQQLEAGVFERFAQCLRDALVPQGLHLHRKARVHAAPGQWDHQ